MDLTNGDEPRNTSNLCEHKTETPKIPAADDKDDHSSVSSYLSDSSIAVWSSKKPVEIPVHVMASALNNNVLVYAIADKYDIDLLKELAQTKFEIRVADKWAVSDVLKVLPNVYTTTPTTDRGLRKPMLDVCLRYMEQLMCDMNFRLLLQEDAGLCFDVLSEVQKQNNEREPYNVAIEAREARFQRIKDWVQTQERAFKELISHKITCRNCMRPLELTVTNGATTDWRGPFTIKCKACKSKCAGS
ncbi:MAG: hypothetical protein Q9213_003129 [Squamulea squamosa]